MTPDPASKLRFSLSGLLLAVSLLALYFATTRQFIADGPLASLPALAGGFVGTVFAKKFWPKSLSNTTFGGGFGGALGTAIPLADTMLHETPSTAVRNGGYGLGLDVLSFLAVVLVGLVIGLAVGLVVSLLLIRLN